MRVTLVMCNLLHTCRVLKLRSELAASAEEVHRVIASNASLQQQNVQLTEQVLTASAATADVQQHLASLRKQLLTARSEQVSEVMAAAAADAKEYVAAAQGMPKLPSKLPSSIVRYIQVLQYALTAADKKAEVLQQDIARAGDREAAARHSAVSASEHALACQRALLHHVRRVQQLEDMRMGDVRELHNMEGQVAALKLEVGRLRQRRPLP